ncbi:hypothetical protein OC846_005094 [Tilletia horrida]|uniref:alcohol dehydrogenase n=1 Tax=Tilletia horrida TaxID=155126 RepID=A0AAN6GP83_9BASI|nr:hypothetical protein OC846_005094 [Tilletia horrida]
MTTDSTHDPRESKLTVPATGRAAVQAEKNSPIEIKDVPVVQAEKLEPGQVLIRMLFSGVCHTDLHAVRGDWPIPSKRPLIGGHEGTGIVCAVAGHSPVKVGDRVGVKWIADACLTCESCRLGEECHCTAGLPKLSGYTVDGTFAQYVVSWARYVTPLPEDLPMPDAAPILCAGVTVYKALKQADLLPGDTVVVLGSGGGLGHLGTQYAAAMGYRVIGIDTGEEKRAFSLKCGVDHFIDFRTNPDVRQAVLDATPDKTGVHAAIVAAASAPAYEQALSYLRAKGSLVALGLPPGTKIQADVFELVVRQKRIIGSYTGNRQDAIEALRLAARGKVKVSYQLRGLSELPKIFEEMEKGQLVGRVVLDIDK